MRGIHQLDGSTLTAQQVQDIVHAQGCLKQNPGGCCNSPPQRTPSAFGFVEAAQAGSPGNQKHASAHFYIRQWYRHIEARMRTSGGLLSPFSWRFEIKELLIPSKGAAPSFFRGEFVSGRRFPRFLPFCKLVGGQLPSSLKRGHPYKCRVSMLGGEHISTGLACSVCQACSVCWIWNVCVFVFVHATLYRSGNPFWGSPFLSTTATHFLSSVSDFSHFLGLDNFGGKQQVWFLFSRPSTQEVRSRLCLHDLAGREARSWVFVHGNLGNPFWGCPQPYQNPVSLVNVKSGKWRFIPKMARRRFCNPRPPMVVSHAVCQSLRSSA